MPVLDKWPQNVPVGFTSARWAFPVNLTAPSAGRKRGASQAGFPALHLPLFSNA